MSDPIGYPMTLPAYPVKQAKPVTPRWRDALMDYEDPTVVWMYWTLAEDADGEQGEPVKHIGKA